MQRHGKTGDIKSIQPIRTGSFPLPRMALGKKACDHPAEDITAAANCENRFRSI